MFGGQPVLQPFLQRKAIARPIDDAAGVREQLAQRDGQLRMRGVAQLPTEIEAHITIEIEHALLHQPPHGDGNNKFRDGGNADHAVRLQWAVGGDVGQAMGLGTQDAVAVRHHADDARKLRRAGLCAGDQSRQRIGSGRAGQQQAEGKNGAHIWLHRQARQAWPAGIGCASVAE